jgi:hypothetical protein
VNAGRLLRETGYDTAILRELLAPVDPDDVNVWPASSLMRRFWRPGIKGVTIRNWVFIDPETLTGDRARLARLVIHELVHVRQFADAGYLGFTSRYLYQYLKGRKDGKDRRQAYLDVAAEREAREVAATAPRIKV